MEKYRLVNESEYLKIYSEEDVNVDKMTERERGKDLDGRMNALLDRDFDSEDAKARAIQSEMQNFITFKKKAKKDSDEEDSSENDKSTRATSTPIRTPKRVSFDLEDDDSFSTARDSDLDSSTPVKSKSSKKKSVPSSSYQSESEEAYPPSPGKSVVPAVVRPSPGDVHVPVLRPKSRDAKVVESNTVYKSRTRKKQQEGGARKKQKKHMTGGWLYWI